ncbi:MAG: cytochrome c [Flavobacteriaceae bacterium]|nr:cytochrome c [Bacteroidia bacterium]MBT8288414.1 cytochrome c [Bacteroidia bacterium]NNF73734.1 cytochrome c [Flavobacteriaceae bacterium]NNK72960.1 cytochrome c [Flavobacteriaceae bacterium]
MNSTLKRITLFLGLLIFGCGGNETQKEEKGSVKLKKQNTEVKTPDKPNVLASATIDLKNKGVGPVKSLVLPAEIDQEMVTQGKDVFTKMCTACHREDKKFIGPPPTGITERRTPEWIMNMILDPEGMTRNDPLARALLIEFNGSPMANQGLTEEDARAVLEYFRTLK